MLRTAAGAKPLRALDIFISTTQATVYLCSLSLAYFQSTIILTGTDGTGHGKETCPYSCLVTGMWLLPGGQADLSLDPLGALSPSAHAQEAQHHTGTAAVPCCQS